MAWNPVFSFSITLDSALKTGNESSENIVLEAGGSQTTFSGQGIIIEQAGLTQGIILGGIQLVGEGNASSLTFGFDFGGISSGDSHHSVVVPYRSGTVALLEDLTGLSVSWDNVANKPLSFPPSSHTHEADDITSGTFANARISQSSVTQHQAALSIGWGQLTGLPAFATRWPTWDEVSGKPSFGSAATSNTSDFASSSDFTRVGSVSGGSYYDYLPSNRGVSYFYHAAGNSPTDAPASPARQTAVLGMDTSWGTAQLAITNENTPQVFVRANGVTSWNRVWTAGDFDPANIPGQGTTVRAPGFHSNSGSGDLAGTTTNSGIRLMPNGWTTSNMTNIDGSGNMTVRGSISDSIGNVRKPEYRTANGTITLASSDVNRIVEKSNNSSYTYTIPSGHGSHGDIITFVNSGTSGNLTINRATGVTLYRNGTNANITVGPGSTVTIYRSATANRWIA